MMLLVSASLYAGTIDPNTPDVKYVEYGAEFKHVVQIVGIKDDGSAYSGSAVAYKRNIIITAAHLFTNHQSAAVVFDQKTLIITKVIKYKYFDPKQKGKHDIAMCLVQGDFGLSWYPTIYTGQRESGSICSLAGYGCTGTFNTGVIEELGCSKRAGSNTIDYVSDRIIYCSPSIHIKRTELEFMTAIGDSGGGLFIGNELAGIHSGIQDNGKPGKSRYGSVSMHTRVSAYQDWINATTIRLIQEEWDE